jgi:hypothetical protein
VQQGWLPLQGPQRCSRVLARQLSWGGQILLRGQRCLSITMLRHRSLRAPPHKPKSAPSGRVYAMSSHSKRKSVAFARPKQIVCGLRRLPSPVCPTTTAPAFARRACPNNQVAKYATLISRFARAISTKIVMLQMRTEFANAKRKLPMRSIFQIVLPIIAAGLVSSLMFTATVA